MDKKFADEMIEKFHKKFFGYALTKTSGIDEAEELAARIVCDAYVTLRRVDGIYNWEGYMYKIASNVYARYINEKKHNISDSIDGIEVSDNRDFTFEMVKKEELELLRREVAWLSKRHREIVLLHYYHNKKISQIAHILEIPSGTVKWHLSDAKKILKEGMNKMRKSGDLGLEPIRFESMGHDGSPGNLGDTSYFLNTKLKQNIAYAAYFTPKTVEEIAKELGVSPVYIEDEVSYLEEYGFLDEMPGHKYRTNIYITDLPVEVLKKFREIDIEVAKEISEEYFTVLEKQFANYREMGIYVPDDDYNYLLWSLTIMAMTENIWSEKRSSKHDDFRVKRKDGGNYIAHASVYREDIAAAMFDDNHYYMCGDMNRMADACSCSAWSVSTYFDTREKGWIDNRNKDYEFLYMYMEGKLPKIESTADKYERLYNRGLLFNDSGKDQVNVVVVKEKAEEDGRIAPWNSMLKKNLPGFSKELVTFIKEECAKKIEIAREYYPEHMHKLLESYEAINVDRVAVLDALLEKGYLKPLSEKQKKGVMIVVYSDILPEKRS